MTKATQRATKRTVLKHLSNLAVGLLHQGGKLTLRHLTTIGALMAVAFYVVGLLLRIAQLEQAGVPTDRGLPLMSLQEYLMAGLAVLVDPGTLFFTVLLILAAGALVAWPRLRDELSVLGHERWTRNDAKAPPMPDVEATPGLGQAQAELGGIIKTERRVLAVILIVCVLLVPLARWVPWATALAYAIALLQLNLRHEFVPFDASTWTGRDAAQAAAAGVSVVLLGVLLLSVISPPPLERVTIQRVAGGPVSGPLLAQSNGAVYVVGRRSGPHAPADVVAVPLGRVVSMRIGEGRRPEHMTIPELLGLRFWRLEGDGLPLRRSPRANPPIWEHEDWLWN